MPSIDYSGPYHARAVATDKDSRAGIGFPIKASGVGPAMRFADKMIVELLPGWTVGTVRLTKHGTVIRTWILRRDENKPRRRGR
jgi:hypothetical protein